MANVDAGIAVVVAWSPATGQVEQVALTLAGGATVAQAIAQSGWVQRNPGADLSVQKLGVWGQLREPGDGLRDGDRVEIYRSLQVDPKESRRQRQAAAGSAKRQR